MKNVFGLKGLMYLPVLSLLFLASCEEKLDFTANDSANVENEAATDGYFEDTDDMATVAVSADEGTFTGSRDASSGRGINKDRLDNRFECATVTIEFAEDNSTDVPHGFITIDFGTGCTDAKGNVRKGKIIIEFKGRRFLPQSYVITTLEGYEVNGIGLEGTRTVTNTSASTEDAPTFNIVLENGKATWPDGTTATREVNKTRQWIRADNPLLDEWRVTGTAAGTNRRGRVYEMTITDTLIYRRECAISARVFMAVAGTKELIVDGKKIVIDYGDGECDRLVTITVNGESKEVEVRGDI